MTEDVCERLDELESRVKELEAENETLRSIIELRGDDLTLGNVWIANQPVGKLVDANRRRTRDNQSRIEDLENGEVNAAAVGGSEKQLPIQQYTAVRKRDGRDAFGKNEVNLYRATFVWSNFQRFSDSWGGKLKLGSSQVRKILTDDELGPGMDSVNANTVKRVMQRVAQYSSRPSEVDIDVSIDDPSYPYHPELLVTFRDDTSENVLWADEDEWEVTMAGLADEAGDETEFVEEDEDAAEDALGGEDMAVFDAEPVTDPAEDTVTGSMDTRTD